MKKIYTILFLLPFFAYSQPTITSFTPESGPIGTQVIITGTNFDVTPGNNIVYFGATQATVSAAAATSLTVTVPSGATYEPITVMTNDKIANSDNSFIVTFEGASAFDVNSFAPKQDISTGVIPKSINQGDLDNDGKSDLIVVNQTDETVAVYRNTSPGDGTITYANPVNFAIGAGAGALAVGDLDNDGLLDICYLREGNNLVTIRKNASSGPGNFSFGPVIEYITGGNPFSVALGDLNEDGLLDIAVANYSSNTVSVYRNTSPAASMGTMTFDFKVDFATGALPNTVAIGDLDLDGKPDLALSNSDGSSVSVLRNASPGDGSITFDAKLDLTTASGPQSVSIGDLDLDGKPDLATANYSGSLSVLRNSNATPGAISFATREEFTTNVQLQSAHLSDLNGDGRVDVVVTNFPQSSVSIMQNTSTGTGDINFTNLGEANDVAYTTGANPWDVAIGDFDGDDKPDMAALNYIGENISVFKNTQLSASILAQRNALMAFYNGTDGDNWLNRLNWDVGNDLGTWHGVTTDGSGNVTSIALSYNNLVGTLPTEVGELTSLEFLDVWGNSLTGDFPSWIGNFPNLSTLALQSNQFTGEIPAEIWSMTTLTQLYLAENNLTGALPAEIGQLTELETLTLSNNSFSGAIPPEIGNLTNLSQLELSNASISGDIPSEITQLTSLSFLGLNGNNLTGSLPADLGLMTSLANVYIYNNQLTGSIPNGLENLTSLNYFFCQNNNLDGNIPAEMYNGTLTNLENFDISNTNVCEPSDVAYQTWTSGLTTYFGSGITCISEESLLMAIYNATDGDNWTDNTGWGTDPDLNNWNGVTADGSGNVTSLNLFDNNLVGTIPDELTDLVSLTNLTLENNPDLTGNIPTDIGNLTNLTGFRIANCGLTGTVPASISNLTNLTSFIFMDTQITGDIPDLSAMTGLSIVELRSNNFTGEIGTKLDGLINLTFITLHSNSGLGGELPSSFYDGSSPALDFVAFAGTQICQPDDALFVSWSNSISTFTSEGIICPKEAIAEYSFTNLSTADDTGNGYDFVNSGANLDKWNRFGDTEVAVEFDGVSTELSLDGVDLIGGTNTVSLSFWVEPYTISSFQDVINIGAMRAYITDAQTLNVNLFLGGVANTVGVPMRTYQWQHVVFTHDGSTNSIYLNGALVDQVAATGTIDVSTSNFIGSAGGASFYQGAVDDISLYDVALNANEVRDLYNVGGYISIMNVFGQGTGNVDKELTNVSSLAGLWSFTHLRAIDFGANGGFFRFRSNDALFQWGDNELDGIGDIDGNDIEVLAGVHAVNFNTSTFEYKIDRIDQIGLLGSVLTGDTNGWLDNAEVVMNDLGNGVYEIPFIELHPGEWKIRANGDWNIINWGSYNNDGFTGTLDEISTLNATFSGTKGFHKITVDVINRNFVISAPDALVASYPFDGNTDDVSGNSYHASPAGEPVFTTDRLGNAGAAYFMEAPGDTLSMNSGTGIPLSGDLTYNMWINPSDLTGPRYLIYSAGEFVDIYLNEGVFNYGDFEGVDPITASPAVVINEWTMLTATLEGANVTLYMNGQVAGTGTSVSTLPIDPIPLYLGSGNAEDAFFLGAMDDVQIFNRALSAEEIGALANQGNFNSSEILGVELAEQTGFNINNGNNIITIQVPSALDISAIPLTFTIPDGATIDPVNGTTLDFNLTQTYTVTSGSGSTQTTYSVVLIKEQDLAAFENNKLIGDWSANASRPYIRIGSYDFPWNSAWYITPDGAINQSCETDNIFTFNEDGTFVIDDQGDTWLTPIQTNDNGYQCGDPSLGVPYNQFTSGTYGYSVSSNLVTLDGQGAYILLADVFTGGTYPVDGSIAVADDVTYEVHHYEERGDFGYLTVKIPISMDENPATWYIELEHELFTDNLITFFSIPEQKSPAIIGSSTIDVEVEFGTDLTALVADFSLSEGAAVYVDGVLQERGETINDYSTSLTYTVVAQNGSQQNYTVNVTEAPQFSTTPYAVEWNQNIFTSGLSHINDVTYSHTNFFQDNIDNLVIQGRSNYGDLIWQSHSILFDGGSGSGININKIQIDANGFIYAFGNFHGTIEVDGNLLTANGNDELIIVKYDPIGTIGTYRVISAPGDEDPYGFFISSTGQFFLSMYYSQNFTLDGVTFDTAISGDLFMELNESLTLINYQYYGTGQITEAPDNSIYLSQGWSSTAALKINPATLETIEQYTMPEAYYLEGWSVDIKANSAGNLVITGRESASGNAQMFVGTLDPSNDTWLWYDIVGGIGEDALNFMDIDAKDNIYLFGEYNNAWSWGGDDLSSQGDRDIFLTKYGNNGQHLWTRSFGTNQYDATYGMVADRNAEEVIISGYFNGTSGSFLDLNIERDQHYFARLSETGDSPLAIAPIYGFGSATLNDGEVGFVHPQFDPSNIGDQLTMEVMLNYEDFASIEDYYNVIVSHRNFQMFIDYNNEGTRHLTVNLNDDDDSNNDGDIWFSVDMDEIGFNPEEWHHVAFSYDYPLANFYFDGEVIATFNFEWNKTGVIGDLFVVQNQTMRVDEVKLWNSTRSINEIREFATTEIDPTTEGLIGYWRFNNSQEAGNDLFTTRDETSFGRDLEFNSLSTIEGLLGMPTLTSSNVTFQSFLVTWNQINNASAYQVQIATDIDFNNIIGEGTTTELAVEFTDLVAETDYFVRVAAMSGDYASPWSNVLSVTTPVSQALSTETDILTFGLQNQTGTLGIDYTNKEVYIDVVAGTDVSALLTDFTLSEGAVARVGGSIVTSGVSILDYSNPVTFSVTAEDGETITDWGIFVYEAVGCGEGVYTQQTGTISDGSGDANYGDDMLCTYLIQGSEGSTVTLTFTEFSTEDTFDFVRVYDGSGDTATLLAELTGQSLPNSITSSGNSLFIVFSTDESNADTGWSANYSINEQTDTEGPSINVSAPSQYEKGSGGVTISATVSDNDSGVERVELFGGKIASEEANGPFSMTNKGGNSWEISVGDDFFDDLGIFFYLVAYDNAGNQTMSAVETIQTSFETNSVSMSTPSGSGELDYGIVSLPYKTVSVSSILGDFGSYDPSVWRLFHWNGSSSVEYQNGFTSFEPGKGYWLLSTENSSASLGQGVAVDASPSDPFQITLRSGWNMIGNPYAGTLNWNAVLAANGNPSSISLLVTHVGGFNFDVTNLSKFRGAFVENTSGSSITLDIPVGAVSGARLAENDGIRGLVFSGNFGFDDWSLGLNLENSHGVYNVSKIGMDHNATEDVDKMETSLLPHFNEFLEISFPSGKTTDFIDVKESHSWNMNVKTSFVGESMTLRWNQFALQGSEYTLLLHNTDTDEIVDMSEQSSYSFQQESVSQPFKVYFGQSDEIWNQVEMTQVAVGSPYPNPFQNQITVPVSIPEGSGNVNFTLFDVTGRKVADLSQDINTNFQNVLIDMNQFNLNNNGTYVLKIQIDTPDNSVIFNKRVVFIK